MSSTKPSLFIRLQRFSVVACQSVTKTMPHMKGAREEAGYFRTILDVKFILWYMFQISPSERAPSSCTVRNDAPNYDSSPSRPHQPRHIPRSSSRPVGSFCSSNGLCATHHPHSNALRSPHYRAHHLHILFICQRTRIKSPSGGLGLEHYGTSPHEQGRHGIGQKTVSW